jgi:hypothetical protein
LAARQNSKAFFYEEWEAAFDYAGAEEGREDVKAAQEIGNFSANRNPIFSASS